MLNWTKSVRAVAVVIFVIGINVGLFTGKIPVEVYSQISMLVIGAYFARRSTDAENGKD